MLTPPTDSKKKWLTPSRKIEILNTQEAEPLPRLLPTYAERDGYPLRLQSAVTPFSLNSSFYEQAGLRSQQKCMELLMNQGDSEARGLTDGQAVLARNAQGAARFTLKVSERTPIGTVVTEGVWWRKFISGNCGVNVLTSQRLTDSGRGSTLYDVAVEVTGA